VFTARYALNPYIKQTRFVFRGLRAPYVVHREQKSNAKRFGGKKLKESDHLKRLGVCGRIILKYNYGYRINVVEWIYLAQEK
jgi:hypothetical protein